MELKLSSGRVVNIERPSVKDRIRCGDIRTYKYEVKDIVDNRAILGDAVTQHSRESAFEYAAAGLGVKIEELDEFTDSEIIEIGLEVERLTELNPKKESS